MRIRSLCAVFATLAIACSVAVAHAQILRPIIRPAQSPVAPTAPNTVPQPPVAAPAAPPALPAAPDQNQTPPPANVPATSPAATAGQGQLVPATTIIGTTIWDSGRQQLGTVKDVMIDSRSGQVAFLLLLPMGAQAGDCVVVPYDTIQANYDAQNRRDYFILNMDLARFRQAPHVSFDHWDTIRTPQFITQVDNYYRGVERTPGRTNWTAGYSGNDRDNKTYRDNQSRPDAGAANNSEKGNADKGNPNARRDEAPNPQVKPEQQPPVNQGQNQPQREADRGNQAPANNNASRPSPEREPARNPEPNHRESR